MRKLIAASIIMSILGTSCQSSKEDVKPVKTSEAEQLLIKLKTVPEYGFMFGHHDDPVYGVGWDGDEGRSDVESVCGDYPALMSFDLGRMEIYGMSSFSWHVDNPSTGKDSWDVSDSTVVKSVLPGGDNHVKFIEWLDKLADYMNSIALEDGTKVPVIFRPWHEHTGSWFWWGQNLCTTEEYKALWRMTYERLQEKGVTQLVYAYSPGSEPKDSTAYLERYPGDDIIDLIGTDIYQFDKDNYVNDMERLLNIMTQVSEAHDKAMAVTETGYEAIPDSLWWTGTLLPVVEKYPVSYVLVWRNARERENHYYAPYPGQVSEKDFVKFYNSPRTLFAKDMNNIK